MNSTERNGLRTWIEVDRRAIRHNVNVFRSLIPKGTKLMAVVKSNAYGHSLIDFSKEMERIGADFLGVDSIVEALALRHEGIHTPILVLGYTVPELFSEAVKNDISLTGSTFETLRAIEKTKLPRPLRVHIKVDSGMHRQGFLLSDLPRIVSILKSKILNHKSSSILIEGLYTHFANAKNPAFPKDTENQLDEFRKWIAAFKKSGLCPIVHAAATAGTILFPQSHFDMVRVGIGLYGLWPAPEVREAYKDRVALAPALTWKSLVTEIKKLPAGSRVGYDLAETLAHNSIIAVVPIGYWHGYPRALSSIGRVMVKGRESKVIGRVSMDMLTVDVSDVATPRVGDEVVVMGGSDVLPVSAAGLSRALDASWYEVVARLNPLIKRIYK
ncbi:MAG: alanine racemase [Candidatus Taylorbacteria bacterium RIFCSPHIGHO2_02_49_25]|uniref:Alanine racemase n=1 Tax=Candidatus Taylorbacteria bacterium RIFCSPHIGHO2_02_49_25 TaxID=1802305 RepID=A0A1G2MIA5_9BACT|nr:MAG: Alanine racemase [Parcubacteria group bacterium GW2011_GWF2_50_9]OHA20834.1 MAG: alanine racemase [Candidatus Taylorbacteria bacterium RIFCSPHIGHO2_01_FULL_49_60]OHA23608.1 MAG: alanine racemase [Candidatus Taylorbacteria bacterium RIFCSPHIGHO2_02_49_25]OHA36609.1 MAG: alanine racemase [Candidatus Taylorbacteria bacterium RIFCSPLOWO2_01_FULL_50_130]OHA37063.1 MAG: alanine racemase [Candidatus Taylorbacteria bacterium RIFCSPLOWO2_02_50_13]OHA40668.1 MAG: alanine racemase [Candidatus Tay